MVGAVVFTPMVDAVVSEATTAAVMSAAADVTVSASCCVLVATFTTIEPLASVIGRTPAPAMLYAARVYRSEVSSLGRSVTS